jgi:hypothetical protein
MPKKPWTIPMTSDIASYRLLEFEHEFVHRRRIAEYDAGTSVLRMPEELRVGDELEPRRLDL